MSQWRRSPRRVGASLGLLQDRLAPESLLGDVQRVWPRAVGSAIAAAAQPVSERGGVLTVACSAAVWAQELELMAPTIVDHLNQLLNDAEVTRLRCVTVPVRG